MAPFILVIRLLVFCFDDVTWPVEGSERATNPPSISRRIYGQRVTAH